MTTALSLAIPLADHPGSALLALPFFVPAVVMLLGIAFLALRDRRKSRDSVEGEDAS